MIAEEKKQALLTVIGQMEDEVAFEKIAAAVAAVLAPAKQKSQGGFMQGSVRYLVDDWDAPLPDSDWSAHA